MTLLSNVVNSSSDVSSHCLNNNNLHTHNNNNNNSSSSLYEKGNTETSLNTTVMDLAGKNKYILYKCKSTYHCISTS